MEDNEAREILGGGSGARAARSEVIDPAGMDLREEVIHLNRVAKVVKGGRRFSFSVLVAVGNEAGIVGVGFGKAKEVPLAIAKAVENAKRSLVRVWRRGTTVPYTVTGRFGSARVLLKPASEGTGIIAGTAVRYVCELAGVNNVLTKSLGSDNIINVVKATLQGLCSLRNHRQVAELRGKTPEELLGRRLAAIMAQQDINYSAARETAPVTPAVSGDAIPEALPVAPPADNGFAPPADAPQ